MPPCHAVQHSALLWRGVPCLGVAWRGVAWRGVPCRAVPCRGVAQSDGSKLVATMKNGRVFTSGDSGATWAADTSIPGEKEARAAPHCMDTLKLARAYILLTVR